MVPGPGAGEEDLHDLRNFCEIHPAG